ncbi:MAG: hypothetical protein ABI851_08640 [Saprospiraceae bacterium]
MDKYHSKDTTYLISEENFVFDEKNHLKQNLILINKEELTFAENSEALSRILSSVQLDSKTNAELVELNLDQSFDLKNWLLNEKIFVLVFGIEPAKLHLQGFEIKNKVYEIMNFRILFVDSISKYINNKTAKAELWSALKEWKNIQS